MTHQHKVLNLSNVGQAGEANPEALAIYNGGGIFASPNHFFYNGPFGANCKNPALLWCTTTEQTALAYLNCRWSALDNISWRAEYINDGNGQRTGTATRNMGLAIGLQHWFSPQVEVRPELAYYRSFDAPAFNGNANFGIAPTSSNAVIGSADIIWHF